MNIRYKWTKPKHFSQRNQRNMSRISSNQLVHRGQVHCNTTLHYITCTYATTCVRTMKETIYHTSSGDFLITIMVYDTCMYCQNVLICRKMTYICIAQYNISTAMIADSHNSWVLPTPKGWCFSLIFRTEINLLHPTQLRFAVKPSVLILHRTAWVLLNSNITNLTNRNEKQNVHGEFWCIFALRG